MSDARSKTLIFAEVRGFCRGVVGALAAFQRAGEKGKPVYVLRELVHNSFVTAEMKQRGAIFVKSPDEATGVRSEPKVSGAQGLRALKLAVAIEAEARRYNAQYGFKFAPCTPDELN